MRGSRVGKVATAWVLLLVVASVAIPSLGQANRPSIPDDAPCGAVKDWQIRIHQASDVAAVRASLIQYIWGTNPREPRVAADTGLTNVADIGPLAGAKIQKLTVTMEDDVKGYAYYIVPTNPISSLVVVHAGHQNGFNEGGGLEGIIQKLVATGFSVLAVYMPGFSPFDKSGHARLYGRPNFFHFFFDTTTYGLRYVRRYVALHPKEFPFPSYKTYSMMGLSGGGWTTTLYAAIDPSISLSFPVAGSLPLSLRDPKSSNCGGGDAEQYFAGLYKRYGYADLYILGSAGRGRKQVQILNANDSCCFAVHGYDQTSQASTRGTVQTPAGVPIDALRAYESRVQRVMYRLGLQGTFQLEIDHYADNRPDGHMVSPWAWDTVILPQLDLAADKFHEQVYP